MRYSNTIFSNFFLIFIISSTVFSQNTKIDKETLEKFNEWLMKRESTMQFSGVVLIAKDFNPIYFEAFGKASYKFNVDNTKKTKFNLGSVNKIFTATAIAQLAQQGKLSLDDLMYKYLDGFKDPRAKKVTIRQLLQHTSGWSAYWGNSVFLSKKDELRTLEDYMAFIKNIPLEFEPGTKSQYSNTGYEILGMIVQEVSGMDYFEYMRENVFKPAGMYDTDAYLSIESVPNMAVGHISSPNKKDTFNENTLIMPSKGTAAGGGYSTAENLLSYTKAILNNKLINNKYEALLRSEFGLNSEPADYIFHNGGAPGVGVHMETNEKTGISVIVLSNIPAQDGLFATMKKIFELTNIPLAEHY